MGSNGRNQQEKSSKHQGHCKGHGILRVLTVLPLLVLLPLPSRAQSVHNFAFGQWEATVFGGGSFLGSNVYTTPNTGGSQPSRAVSLRYGTGYQMGARIADNGWQHWGTAVEYSFSNQPITFTNLSDSTPNLGLGHSIHRFSYDVSYYFRDKDSRYRPYILAGPGVSLFYIKGSSKDAAAAQGIKLSDPWKFTMNWGGGIKYLLVNQVAASFQFKDSISGVPGYGLPETGTAGSAGFRPEGYLHNWLISVGFAFQWDEK